MHERAKEETRRHGVEDRVDKRVVGRRERCEQSEAAVDDAFFKALPCAIGNEGSLDARKQ